MHPTVEAAYRAEVDYCIAHPDYFVQTYCHIEDKDTTEIVVPFTMWPAQREALLELHQNRLNIILKARQLGITWLALSYAAYVLLQPGKTVVAMSRTEAEAKELIRRMGVIVGNAPELFRDTHTQALTCTVHHPNGMDSVMQAFPAAAGAARSFTANLIVLDEWAFQTYAREIWASAYPTINRPTGGKVIGLSTIKRGTLFEDIWNGDFGFHRIFIPWSADPRRTQEWYDRTHAALGDQCLAEYPSTAEEALTVTGGAFFPEIRGDIHLTDHLPNGECRRYVSLDYGLDKLACYWHCVDLKGNDIVYRELAKSGLIVSEAAAAILSACGNEDIECVYAPPDLWNRNRDTGRSTAEIFSSFGLPMRMTSNDRVQGWLDLKEWLAPRETANEQTGERHTAARMRFLAGTVPYLWDCLVKIQRDDRRPNDCANDPHELTHGPDALRAFAAGRPMPALEPELPRDPYFDDLAYEDQVGEFFRFGG